METQTDSKAIALKFNECIGNADIEGLVGLMTDDHVFIDMANARIEGKLNNRKMAWEPFFRLFPGYHNIFKKILVKGSTVILQGYAVCSDEVLNNLHAIWIAEIVKGKVSLWHIYPDTKENRDRWGL